jgi:hypothetical protein
MRSRNVVGALAVLSCAGAVSIAWAGDPVEDAGLPPSARPAPNGMRADLSVSGAGGRSWRLRVYRRRAPGRHAPARLPGRVDYCLATEERPRGSGGTTCGLSAALALRLDARGLLFDCGGGGWILGEPAPAGPTCGLVDAGVGAVTVGVEGAPPRAAVLSAPFGVSINRSASILRRSGIDPDRVRHLPLVPQARAFLAFVDTPPTPPGERTPRLTVTATRVGSDPIVRTVGGRVIPKDVPPVDLKPPPGAPRVRLSAVAADGGRWTSTAWRGPDGGLCASARRAHDRRSFSLGCHGRLGVVDNLWNRGVNPYVGTAGKRDDYVVYGFTRGDATALRVTGPDGRIWDARLSRPWAMVWRGRRGNHLKRFRRLPRSIRARAFLAVLSGQRPGQRPRKSLGIGFRTTLVDGRTLVRMP